MFNDDIDFEESIGAELPFPRVNDLDFDENELVELIELDNNGTIIDVVEASPYILENALSDITKEFNLLGDEELGQLRISGRAGFTGKTSLSTSGKTSLPSTTRTTTKRPSGLAAAKALDKYLRWALKAYKGQPSKLKWAFGIGRKNPKIKKWKENMGLSGWTVDENTRRYAKQLFQVSLPPIPKFYSKGKGGLPSRTRKERGVPEIDRALLLKKKYARVKKPKTTVEIPKRKIVAIPKPVPLKDSGVACGCARMKRIEGMLKKAEAQRLATHEHNVINNRVAFRNKVLGQLKRIAHELPDGSNKYIIANKIKAACGMG